MTSFWHWFIILGTLGTLVALLALLFSNRSTSGKETTGHTWDGIQELDNPLPMWWVWLFVGSIAFAVPLLIYYPGLGSAPGVGNWTAANQLAAEDARHEARFAPLYAELGGMSEAELHGDQRAAQVGRRLFLNHCATCHGMSAQGAFGFPNLTDTEWLWGADFETVNDTIANGRIAVMPPWSAALSEAASNATAHHVRALAGLEHDAEQAVSGAEHYQLFCVACHGADGKGDPSLGAPDLTDDSWLYGSTLGQLDFTIRQGRRGEMPAHDDILTPAEIRIVSAYVTSLAPAQ